MASSHFRDPSRINKHPGIDDTDIDPRQFESGDGVFEGGDGGWGADVAGEDGEVFGCECF